MFFNSNIICGQQIAFAGNSLLFDTQTCLKIKKRRGGGFKSQIPNRKQEKERRRVKSLRTNKCSTFQTSAHALDKSDTETVLICIARTPSPCRTFAYIIASVIINTNPALCYFGKVCLFSQM